MGSHRWVDCLAVRAMWGGGGGAGGSHIPQFHILSSPSGFITLQDIDAGS